MISPRVFYKFLSGLNKRERAVLYFAAFILAVTLLDRLIIYPIYSKITSLNKAIKDEQIEIARDVRMLSQKERILIEAKKYDAFLSLEESEDESMTGLLKEIETIANKSSLYIIDMKPGQVKEEKNNVRKFLVNLSCEGQMEQIIDFMFNIENSGSLLTIEKYQIAPKSKESSVAQCTMTVSKIVMRKEE